MCLSTYLWQFGYLCNEMGIFFFNFKRTVIPQTHYKKQIQGKVFWLKQELGALPKQFLSEHKSLWLR